MSKKHIFLGTLTASLVIALLGGEGFMYALIILGVLMIVAHLMLRDHSYIDRTAVPEAEPIGQPKRDHKVVNMVAHGDHPQAPKPIQRVTSKKQITFIHGRDR